MLIVCPHCLTTNRVPQERTSQDPVCGNCSKPLLDGETIDLHDADFNRIVTKTEMPIVVDFWASWCGPCLTMAPQFKLAAKQLKGRALFAKVDSDANPQTSARFGIRSIPTLLLLRGGQEVKRQAGAIQASQIVAWVEAG
jgi:thioredoxin 2